MFALAIAHRVDPSISPKALKPCFIVEGAGGCEDVTKQRPLQYRCRISSGFRYEYSVRGYIT